MFVIRKNKFYVLFLLILMFFAKSLWACFVIDGYTNDWPTSVFIDNDAIGDAPGNKDEDIKSMLIYDEVDIHGQTNLYIAFVFVSNITDTNYNRHILYIDADHNTNTGAPKSYGPYWYNDSFGADYQLNFYTYHLTGFYGISLSKLEYWDEVATNWVEGATIWNASYYSNIVELEIPFSVLTNHATTMAFAFQVTGLSNATNINQYDVNNDVGSSNILYSQLYGVCPDNDPPQLVYSDPADGEVFVSIDKSILIRLDDNAYVRSNTISITVDFSNAIINGVFQPGFSGTIIPYNTWGWEIFINPDNDFAPNSTLDVSVSVQDRGYNNLNKTFSFTTAYGVIVPPPPPPPGISPLKQGQYYWGWVFNMEGGKNELPNGGYDTNIPYKVISDFDYFFIPEWETLDHNAGEDADYYAHIIPKIRAENPNIIIFASIDTGSQNFSTSSNHAELAIAKFNPDGIMWANLTGVSRTYQNQCWDFVNAKGLKGACTGGGGNPESVFSNSSLPTTAKPGTIFMEHNFMISNGTFYSDYSTMIQESLDLYHYKNTLGIETMALGMDTLGANWGDYDTVASLNRQDFAYLNALLYGHSIFSYSDEGLCYVVSDEYLYWYPESRMPYIGTTYLSSPQSNSSSGNWERLTDTGVIWVDYSSDTAGFSPYGIYYVDISIGNNGATPAQAQNPATPWKTIGHAISNVNAGSIIKVKPTGTYNETMTIINGGGGFWNLPITIEGDGGKPDVTGSFVFNAQLVTIKNLNITATSSNAIYLLSTASNVVIEDCIIHDTGIYAGIRCDGHKNYIINNVISNAIYGVQLSGSGSYNNYVANNTIYNTTIAGIYSENSSKSNTIAFNDMYNNYHGIYLNNSDNNGIMLNHIYDNSQDGIYVNNSQNVIVKNNTCVNNNNGIHLTGTDTGTTIINNITMSNTIGYNSEAGAWSVTYSCSYNDTSAVNNFNGGTFTSGTGCVTIDPIFSSVASRDLRLGINTTLLDKGTSQQIAGAIGGTGVSVIPADSTPNVVTSHAITFTTPYPNGAIPVDGKIVLVYPSGFDISSISVSSSTIDGGFIVSIYSNQITIARDGSGTKTNPGETYSLTINNIRNTTAIGINTIYWKITDSYDQDLFGPQISNDINIGDPFTVLVTTPNNGAVGYSLTNDVKVVFSQNVKASTVNSANFKIYNDEKIEISGSLSANSNVAIFSPDNSLSPNEWYFCVVTTGIQNTNDVALYEEHTWKFKTEQGEKTLHEYNSIVCDGNIAEWHDFNIVTYDSSNTESLHIESVDDSGDSQTEEFWGTWNTNTLSFCLRKDNTGSSIVNWYDYIAIDITKDDRGADSFNSSFATYSMDFSFSNYRKPEFIIMLNHNDGGVNWAGAELSKWTGSKWTNLGSAHLYWQGSGVNNSEYIECGIDISILSNSAVNAFDPIPNRISVLTFTHQNDTTYDYCPESPTWLNMDIDNDGNNVPDFVIPNEGPFYVDAQAGNDGYQGTSISPFKSIERALSLMNTQTKNTVYCRGIFDDNTQPINIIGKVGTASSPVLLRNWDSTPIIKRGNAQSGIVIEDCTNLIIQGFDITEIASLSTEAIFKINNSKFVTFLSNYHYESAMKNGKIMSIDNSHFVTIDKCFFSSMAYGFIFDITSFSNFSLLNSSLSNIGSGSTRIFDLAVPINNIIISNTSIFNCNGYLMYTGLVTGNNIKIADCSFYDNTFPTYPFYFRYTGSDFAFINNQMYDNAGVGYALRIYNSFDNFSLINNYIEADGTVLYIDNPFTGFVMRNNYLKAGTGDCIYVVANVDEVTIISNFFYIESAGFALRIEVADPNFLTGATQDDRVIRNNVFVLNGGSPGIGFRLYGSTTQDFTIRNNTFIGNIDRGMQIGTGGNISIRNNIIYDNVGTVASYGIMQYGGTITADYNDLYNVSDNFWSVTTEGIHNVFANPQFLNETLTNWLSTNFIRIPTVSPCFDAGDPVDDTDPQVYGAHIDIGAFENTNVAFPLLRVITSNILLNSAYGNKKIPGSRMHFEIKYDNDSSAVANNGVIEVVVSSNVSYVSNSASQNNNFHTGAVSVTIEVFDGSSWILDNGTYNPNLVQKIRWIFSDDIGSDDNSEGNDTLSSVDGEFPDSDAGIVRYEVIIK